MKKVKIKQLPTKKVNVNENENENVNDKCQ